MTIARTTSRTAWFAANGVNRTWPFDFMIRDLTDAVMQVRIPDGTIFEYAPTQAAGMGPDATEAGGSIVFPVAPTAPIQAGNVVRIVRRSVLTQETMLKNQSRYDPAAVESAFDEATLRDQEMRAAIVDIPAFPGAVANKIIGWNAAGTKLENVTVVSSASMVKANDADIVAGVDDFRYTTPRHLALGRRKQVFSTRAEFRAATIAPDIAAVEVLGTNNIGDNGAATFVRIPPAAAARWREQSADGQWWVINDRVITPEMFSAFPGADCTAAFVAMADCLNTFSGGGGYVINFAPNANYPIWPAGTVPGNLFVLNTLNGLTFNYNGARLSTNNEWAGPGGAVVFYLMHCSDIIVNNPWYEATAVVGAISAEKYGIHFYISEPAAPWSHDIIICNAKQTWGSGFVVVSGDTTGATQDQAYNIALLNADLTNVFYGINCQGSGDNLFARGIRMKNGGRIYYPWNVRNHDVELIKDGGGNGFVSVLLACYAQPMASRVKRTLGNIRVRFTNSGETDLTAVAVGIGMQQIADQINVTGAANNGAGLLRLTVNSTAELATGQTWFANSIGGITNINGKSYTVTKIDATHVDLQGSAGFGGAYTAGGYMRVPAAIRDIDIQIENTIAVNQPASFVTYKYNKDGSPDLTTSDYTVENIRFTGSIKGYNYGTAVMSLFNNNAPSIGTWVGESVRNISLRDLTISGTNTTCVIDATNVQANLVIENVWSTPATVVWNITGAGANTRMVNVSGTGLTDHLAVVPSAAGANQVVTGLDNTGALIYAAASSITSGVASASTITNDTTTNATMFPVWVTANTGNLPLRVSSTKVTFNPSTGLLSATAFAGSGAGLTGVPLAQISGTGSGVLAAGAINIGLAGSFVLNGGAGGTPASILLTNATGTAAGLTAGNVTVNANLTGPITSVGNATSVASQTGTGTKFVMDNGPQLINPNIGAANGQSLVLVGNLNNQGNGAVFGSGGTGTNSVVFNIDGGSAVGGGAKMNFQRNTVSTWTLGHAAALTGSATNDIGWYNWGVAGYAITLVASTNATIFGGAVAKASGNVTLANGLNSNIATPAKSWVRITGPTAAFSVGGFTGGVDGLELVLYNTVAFAMTITNEDAASTAGNRIKTLTGADVVLRAGTSAARLQYDATGARWILISTN